MLSLDQTVLDQMSPSVYLVAVKVSGSASATRISVSAVALGTVADLREETKRR